MTTNLFRIEVFVEDKRLAEVLRMLTGKVHDLHVVPVTNAALDSKTKRVTAVHTGSIEAFIAELRKEKGPINAEAARKAVGAIGGSKASYSYFLQRAKEVGALKNGKRSGNHMVYEWVK